MILIFQTVIKIAVQMQAFTDSDFGFIKERSAALDNTGSAFYRHLLIDTVIYHTLHNLIAIVQHLSQTSPGFYLSTVQVFLKTPWGKKKLLVTSNFFFSRSVFHPFRELSAIFIKLKIVACKLFQFGRV